MTEMQVHSEPEVDEVHAQHEHGHPSDWTYIKVALFLAVITAVEVGLYYVDMSSEALIASLMPLMIIKFAGVVWWFMHLKFDSRTFRQVFIFGLGLAVSVYMIVLLTFHFFT
jgi:hypothetical protein